MRRIVRASTAEQRHKHALGFAERKTPRAIAVACGVGVLSITLAGCGASKPTASHQVAAGTLTTTAPTAYLPTQDWNIFSTTNSAMNAIGVLAFSPLAIIADSNKDLGDDFYGQLASSWGYSPSGNQFIVHLRPHLKWDNGQPLTSHDVKVTWDLFGLQGVWAAADITNVTTPNNTTVVFDLNPTALFSASREQTILTPFIAPASLYGKFLPKPSTFAAIIGNLASSNPSSAKDSLGVLDTKLVKKLESYNPGKKGLITAGPYKVTGFTGAEVIATKNPDNWAAKNVHVETIILRNQVSTTAFTNGLIDGTFDVTGYQPTTPLYDSIMARNKPYYHYARPTGFLTNMGTLYNMRKYPLNLLAVRQAFEYLLNRSTLNAVADPVAARPVPIPTGVALGVAKAYLTPAQMKTLNPYHYNPKKAAALLRSAHFTKRHGQWYLPNGKPFTLTVQSTASLASWDLLASGVASELTHFGIPAKVSLWPTATFSTELEEGKYSIFEGYNFSWPYQPWGSFPVLFETGVGSDTSYTSTGKPVTTPGDYGMDMPHKAYVPGIGTIDPIRLSWEFTTTKSPTKQKQIAYDLIKFMNYNAVPGTLIAQNQSFFYSTKRFTDWPTHRSFWSLGGDGSGNYLLTVAEEQGYIRPISQ